MTTQVSSIHRSSNLAVCIQFGNVEKIGVKSLCDLISEQAAYSILVEHCLSAYMPCIFKDSCM